MEIHYDQLKKMTDVVGLSKKTMNDIYIIIMCIIKHRKKILIKKEIDFTERSSLIWSTQFGIT